MRRPSEQSVAQKKDRRIERNFNNNQMYGNLLQHREKEIQRFELMMKFSTNPEQLEKTRSNFMDFLSKEIPTQNFIISSGKSTYTIIL